MRPLTIIEIKSGFAVRVAKIAIQRDRAGAFIQYRLRLHGVPVRWNTLIQAWDPPLKFIDVQVKGPYKLWHHTHTFEAVDGGTLMKDIVRYDIGYGPLGDLADRLLVAKDLKSIFDYRVEAVLKALAD